MMDLEQGKYFSLNPVATRIWDLLEDPLTENQLCGLLLEEYEVDPEQCLQEVEELLAEMVKLRLVVPEEAHAFILSILRGGLPLTIELEGYTTTIESKNFKAMKELQE